MSRKSNFLAGPAALPVSVLTKIQDDMVHFHGAGLALIESSHRTPLYDDVHQLIRELMGIPSDYHVLLLGGGATLQFGMIPLNLLAAGKTAHYIHSGAWAKWAIGDAKVVGNVRIVWDGESVGYDFDNNKGFSLAQFLWEMRRCCSQPNRGLSRAIPVRISSSL